MTTGNDLIALDGTDLIDNDGNDVLDEGDSNTCCCGSEPHYVCGSDNTCNEWCDPTKKDFSAGPNCTCPCSGQRGYPPAYRLHWSGITIWSGRHALDPGYASPGHVSGEALTTTFELYNPDDGDCVYDGHAAMAYQVEEYDADDNPLGASDHHLDDSSSASVEYALECDGRLHITGSISGNNPWEPGVTTVATVDGYVDPCLGGRVLGEIGDSIMAVDGGAVTVEPICELCNGDPMQTGTDPASVCGGTIEIDITVWNGTTWVAYVITLFGGGGYWAGSGNDGSTAVITTRGPDFDGEKCCDTYNRKEKPCDCNASPGNFCDTCYSITITTPEGTFVYHDHEACPNNLSNFISYSGSVTPPDPMNDASMVLTASIGFTTDCP